MEPLMMAIDAGTTSNRCILFNQRGDIVSVAQKELTQFFPKPGYVEQDAGEIYSTQMGVCMEAMSKIGITSKEIAGIGITNQRETTIVWEKETGLPIAPAIVWQCRRTADFCKTLELKKEFFQEKTGLIVDPYFSATKVKWILDHVEGARERAKKGELLFGTVETWLIWKMTGGRVHVTDYSNASRTMMFNIHTLTWDEEILELLDIPSVMLPKVVSSSEVYGNCMVGGLEGIPISGAAGDQQAALFGQNCFTPGSSKNTYGTGCFLLMNTGDKPICSRHGLVTTIAWGLQGKITYALEGSIFVGGSAIQWLRDEMRFIQTAAESEELALQVEDTNGCFVVPAFTGLGAPYWDPYARGTIVGLTRGVNRNHIVRATLDSIGYQVNDILQAMYEDSGIDLVSLNVDGGASKNNYLMQTQADLSGIPVNRPSCVETTALGAAYLAGLSVGYWKSLSDIQKNASTERVFMPTMGVRERQSRLDQWKKAVKTAFSWAKED